LVPFYNIYGHKVWGATAMILSEFLILLQEYSRLTRQDSYAATWSYA
jgi:hypothetical protein